jgi:hypothetical protein
MSRSRVSVLGVSGLVALGLCFALVPARGQQIHRHTFSGKQVALVRGDANVRVTEQEHDVSTSNFHSQPSSEHLKLVSDAGTGDTAFIHYYYETPPAPVSEALSASVWVKAFKPGVQLRARVVFPKEPDPARPESPLTMLIVGSTLEASRRWEKLTLTDVPALVEKHAQVKRLQIGRAINTDGAYVDRLVLNLYTGPGPLDVWVDDLDIGPVRTGPQPGGGVQGIPTKQPKAGEPAPLPPARTVEHRDRQILVDGKPYFFRAIRHTGTPLHVLRAAGFEALWVPADSPPEFVDEAAREGWLLIPAAPVAGDDDPTAVINRDVVGRDADRLGGFLRRFADRDVLFWDLGWGRGVGEPSQPGRAELDRVSRTADTIRSQDPRRPRGVGLYNGFQAYSEFLEVVETHRWPLFTSLELSRYKDWLTSRKAMTAGRATYWTWVQNHLPEWYVKTVMEPQPAPAPGGPVTRTTARGQAPAAFPDPIGPHPEQVRLLSYIAVASGCRGLGFWSDVFLADSHHGRDRLQQMALLNAELDLLSPVILGTEDHLRPIPIATSNPNVQAFLFRGRKGLLLLPIWMGPGTQYVPPQGAVKDLSMVVQLIPDGYQPWLVTPVGPECLTPYVTRQQDGVKIVIPEFDLVSPIVFTDDLAPNGLVVWWQDHARKFGRLAARWAIDLAVEEYQKTLTIHQRLATEHGVMVKDADRLFAEADRLRVSADRYFAHEQYKPAYQEATRALRPLRVVARDHWEQAARSLDVPTASPYAVSLYSLPRHWELFNEVQTGQLAANRLPGGTFEVPGGEVPAQGLAVATIPGWHARYGSLDKVVPVAAIVPSAGKEDNRIAREPPKRPRGPWSPGRPAKLPDEGYVPPAPELGKACLMLQLQRQQVRDKDGKAVTTGSALESTFLAVDSPVVSLPPGSLVRISGWVKLAGGVQGSADGVLIYDDAGGEPLAYRVLDTNEADVTNGPARGVWKQFHLYRRVPQTGQLGVTLALTGVGTAYFDDVRIEPILSPGRAPAAPPRPTTAGTPVSRPR